MLLAPLLDGIYFCGETQRREEAVLSAKMRVRGSRMSPQEVQTCAKSKWGLYLDKEQVGVIWSYKLRAAMTDRDEALHYLLNKLKSEDGWSSSNLTWNDEKLAVISDQFSSFDGVVKAKVLLSFLSMSPRTINQVYTL